MSLSLNDSLIIHLFTCSKFESPFRVLCLSSWFKMRRRESWPSVNKKKWLIGWMIEWMKECMTEGINDWKKGCINEHGKTWWKTCIEKEVFALLNNYLRYCPQSPWFWQLPRWRLIVGFDWFPSPLFQWSTKKFVEFPLSTKTRTWISNPTDEPTIAEPQMYHL